MFKKSIIIRTEFSALHHYPTPPVGKEFLAHPHRHKFYVKVGIQVGHVNRDREFFEEIDRLETCLRSHMRQLIKKADMDHKVPEFSCESLAENLLIAIDYYDWVEIWEDNENGARVERVPCEKSWSELQDEAEQEEMEQLLNRKKESS